MTHILGIVWGIQKVLFSNVLVVPLTQECKPASVETILLSLKPYAQCL